jgi:hypothetical protein
MERLRQVTLLAGLLAPLATGCAGLHEARHTTLQKLGIETPAPAAEFQCAWQNRLAQLPDPTKNGANVTGLPGQMFLFQADMKPATATGDLTVIVIDETPRPHGMVKKTDEVWHFGKDKLEKMAAVDEKFGRNFVLFIPWPDHWRDVSRVRLKARYDQTVDGKKATLYAQDSLVTLDFVGGAGAAMTPQAWGPRGSVPDPTAVMNQMKATGQAQAAANWPAGQAMPPTPYATVPAGYTAPAANVPSATSPIWGAPPPASATSPAPGGGMVVPAVLP